MTYSLLLLLFVALPILALVMVALWNRLQRRAVSAKSWGGSPGVTLATLMVVALLYTIPWDSHLIGMNVWRYRRDLISGMTLGFIPLEEVAFFLLQTVLVGLWLLSLAPHVSRQSRFASALSTGASTRMEGESVSMRWLAGALGAGLWLAALLVIHSAWRPGTYIGWELAWALPPLTLQFAFGADILWKYRRLLAFTIVPATLYLCMVDAIAIHVGIWTIDQRQTLDVVLGGQLPLEEIIFYTLTSALVACGLTLGAAVESRSRLRAYYTHLTSTPR